MNKKGKLFVISGSSGVGKGTLIKALLESTPNIHLSISFTTRQPRLGEVNRVDYFFVNKEEFIKSIENQEFLEWAQFNENYYGTKLSYVKETLDKGKNLILEIETLGAMQVKEKMPEAVFIFILPPSFEELEKRLRGRNTEDEETVKARLNEAYREIEASKEYDYRIVNDNIERALTEIQEIIER